MLVHINDKKMLIFIEHEACYLQKKMLHLASLKGFFTSYSSRI